MYFSDLTDEPDPYFDSTVREVLLVVAVLVVLMLVLSILLVTQVS